MTNPIAKVARNSSVISDAWLAVEAHRDARVPSRLLISVDRFQDPFHSGAPGICEDLLVAVEVREMWPVLRIHGDIDKPAHVIPGVDNLDAPDGTVLHRVPDVSEPVVGYMGTTA